MKIYLVLKYKRLHDDNHNSIDQGYIMDSIGTFIFCWPICNSFKAKNFTIMFVINEVGHIKCVCSE